MLEARGERLAGGGVPDARRLVCEIFSIVIAETAAS
jgi:hypothetical protein